jgi:hypothetical protein
MTQYLRPNADISAGSWTTTPLWQKLDEATPDDATTQIQSAKNPSADTFEVGLTAPGDTPGNRQNHNVLVRMNSGGKAGYTAAITLLQGTTVIQSFSGQAIPAAYGTITCNVTEANAQNITDYSQLRVRVAASGGNNGRAFATWIEVQVPDAPIQKSGTASINGTVHVLGIVKKGAIILAAISAVAAITAHGFKSYPVILHGGGTISVAGEKNVRGPASISGGWSESQVVSGKKGTSNTLYVITGADVFDQPSGSYLGDDPEWSDGGGFKVKDGGAYCEIQTTGENLFLGGIVPPANEFVQAVIVGEGDNAFVGLTLRNGHYKVWFRIGFGDVVAWRDDRMLGQFSYPVHIGDTVRVEAKGSIFQAIVNDIVVSTFEDATYPSPGRGGILGLGPSSGVKGVPPQLDDFIFGYNYGFTIRGGGNIFVWSEDHYGDAAIGTTGTVAVAGKKGGLYRGIPYPALQFDGVTGSYADVFPRDDALGLSFPYAVEVWARYRGSVPGTVYTILGLASDQFPSFSPLRDFVAARQFSSSYWYAEFPEGQWMTSGQYAWPETWTHVVFYLPQPNRIEFYINGQFNFGFTWGSGTSPFTPGRMTIGAKAGSSLGQNSWQGDIAQLRVYKEALDASKIAALFNDGKGILGTPSFVSPVVEFLLQEEGSTRIYSPHTGHYADLHGGITWTTGVLSTPFSSGNGTVSAQGQKGGDGQISVGSGGVLLATTAKNALVSSAVPGGGTIHASAREEVYRAGVLSGGGAIVLAAYKGARGSARVIGNGTVLPTVRRDALGQPVISGGGSLAVERYVSQTVSYVWAHIRGGGEITATSYSTRGGAARISSLGRIAVRWARSWPFFPASPPGVDDATALIVKIHLSCCGQIFGVGECLATGTPCYNTWRTCRYLPAYQDVGKEYRFCSADMPQVAPDARPYVLGVKWMPTEIATNLTVSARVTVDMIDEPDEDVGIDPYWTQRTSHPGTFWKKLLARNANYRGRTIEIYEGKATAPQSTYVLRWIGRLSNITLSGGKVAIESTDLLKDLTKIEVPPKTNSKLAAAVAAGYTQGILLSQDVDRYPPSGYVRIDDEIIRYESKDDVTKQLSTLTRGQFGTVDANHEANTKAQPVRYFEPKSGFDHLLDMLLLDAGMAPENVDAESFAYWKAWPAEDIPFTAVISEPTKLSDLFFEVVDLLDCKVWVAENLKVTIRRNIQNQPGRAYHPVTDDSEIAERSGAVDWNEASRITRISCFWNKDPLGKKDDYSAFRRLDISVDPDAEANYDGVIEKVVLCRWVDPTVGEEGKIERYIRNLGLRRITRQRDAQPLVTVDLPPKDSGVLTGDFVVLTTDELLDQNGAAISRHRYQVVKRERKGTKFAVKLLQMARRRVCIIAPAGIPDYKDATEAQKEYGFVSDGTGKMSDGADGYFLW